MKKIIVLMAIMLVFIGSFALAEDYKLIKRLKIGPGTTYSYYEESTHPWNIHLAEIDLTNSYIKLESVKAKDKMQGFERVSSMSSRNNREGHQVVMGVNGDFYNTSNGIPINNQVSNGEFVQGYSTWGTAFTYSEGSIPDITIVQFSGKVLSKNGSGQDVSYPLKAVNTSRGNNDLLIFNNFYGSSTGTIQDGYECVARAITDWVVNDTVFAVIEACEDSVGNMTIPNGKFVLSGQNSAKDFLQQNCQVGDTVRVIQKLADSPDRLTQMVGGGPWFLQNGVDVISPADITRHPRTGVGFSADSTTLYFMVVDGRSTQSVGMDYHHMSDFFMFVGARHAMNLDGGGSSTFVVRNGVVNTTSDGDERTVSNSMLCISSAPSGQFSRLQTAQDSIAVYKNKSVNLEFSGWDENYNPTGIPDWNQLTVVYDHSLGTFDSNVFTANELDGNTYLTADYNGDKDSVLIHIIELYDLSIYPETVTVDSVNSVEFQVSAMNESGSTIPYDNNYFEFSILDPTLASIDESGRVIGKNTGTTKVIVRYGSQTDTADVNIEIGEGEVVVDELESSDGWTISGDSYINMSETGLILSDRVTATGTKAFRIDYSRTGAEDGNIYLETDPINVYGVPSDILVDVLSDSNKNWIYVVLEDARGVEYSVKSASSLRYNDAYRTQYLDMGSMLPADGEQLYPMKLTGIRLRIDDAATTGSMYVDRIRVIYPTWTAIADDTNEMLPSEYCLHQNYPNPFNPLTKISYEIAKAGQVNLSVYDITGIRVATLVQGYQNAGMYHVEFLADKLSTGVYFYRIESGDWIDTKKMLIIK